MGLLLVPLLPPARGVVSPMRATPVLAALAAAGIALVALAPAASAATEVCTTLTAPECPGVLCTDENGDRVFQPHECTRPRELLDLCAFQTDCCGRPLGPGFWCPEDS